MAGTIYYATYPMPLPTANFQALLEQLPVYMQKKIAQLRRWEDAHASLLGKHLLLRALKAQGSNDTLLQLRYSGYGRPFLEGNMDFNISHAGRMVACVVSLQARVGIDLEVIRPIDITAFKRQFTDREWQAINSAPNPVNTFFSFWTCKEAVLKADGSALHGALTEIDVTDKKPVVLDGHNWYLREIKAFRDYACHIAVDKKGIEFAVEEVKF